MCTAHDLAPSEWPEQSAQKKEVIMKTLLQQKRQILRDERGRKFFIRFVSEAATANVMPEEEKENLSDGHVLLPNSVDTEAVLGKNTGFCYYDAFVAAENGQDDPAYSS